MTTKIISEESIQKKIFVIREKKVMLDRDLAKLYGVKTSELNKAVTRNLDRFPPDFMYQLTRQELRALIFHFGTSKRGGTRKLPRAFTEHGILMLSSVLKSKKAIQINIEIMRTFMKLREVITNHKELWKKIELIEAKYDRRFAEIFEIIKKLIIQEAKPKRKIGF